MAASIRRHLGPAALMGGGLMVVGLAGYVFLGLSGHTLPTADAAAVASFYLIVSIAGPGVFVGLEQETSRSASAWLATGGRLGIIARRAAVVGLGLLAVVVLVLGALSPVMTGRALSGRWGLFVAIIVAVFGSAAVYLARGLLGATRRFTAYSVNLAAEGLSRIVLCVAVFLAGWVDPTVYSFAFAAGAGFAVLAALPWLRHRSRLATTAPAGVEQATAGAGEPVAVMARGLGLLVAATLGFQVVANLAPVLVTARLPADTATAAAFAAASVLVRVPVLLFVAIQAMLLPALTRAATLGDRPAVRAALRQLMVIVGVIGVATVSGSALLGPWAVEVLFGAQVRLSHTLLGLLAVGTILLMVTQVLLPALIAFGKHRTVMLAWAAGAVVLIGPVLVSGAPVATAVWAQLAGCVLAAGLMAVSVIRSLRQPVVPDRVPVPTLTGN